MLPVITKKSTLKIEKFTKIILTIKIHTWQSFSHKEDTGQA